MPLRFDRADIDGDSVMKPSDTGIRTTFPDGVCNESGDFDCEGVTNVSGIGFIADVPGVVCP